MVFRQRAVVTCRMKLAGDYFLWDFPSLVIGICYSDSQTVFGFQAACSDTEIESSINHGSLENNIK